MDDEWQVLCNTQNLWEKINKLIKTQKNISNITLESETFQHFFCDTKNI